MEETKKSINLNTSVNSGQPQPRYLIRRGVKTPLRPEIKKKTKTGGSKGQPPKVFNMNELNE